MRSDYQGNKKKHIGLKYALDGIRYAFSTEWNLRIHGIAFISVIVLSLLLQISRLEWTIVIFVSGLVMVTEMLNTVIEHLLDYLAPERHPLVGRMKDMMAGTVFIAACIAVVIGCIIFLPKLIAMY
ncbi:diacylglycerol kinase family protein [Paraliobacillus sp. JSM ZJ581]|uniref:diacylglycerol kinase family protein n=1 Tax=Paraliobacillus sp. JSM ZJ581 TaxID=3342118 RepID=UPI0035A94B54